jgi:heterodisulfide reductase subunit C
VNDTNETKEILVSDLDKDFKYEIAARPGAAYFKRCFSCGSCTASCPVAEIDEAFNPRLIIRQALFGQKKEVLSSRLLWYCSQCYTCYARCPQDVRFTDIMAVLRDMAVEAGYAPQALITKTKAVDLLARRIRHGLAEVARRKSAGEPCDKQAAELKKLLAAGLKELE